MFDVVTVKVTEGGRIISSYFRGEQKVSRHRDDNKTMGEDVKSIVEETVRNTSNPFNWYVGLDTENNCYVAVYMDFTARVGH